jgi:hypothetical protein
MHTVRYLELYFGEFFEILIKKNIIYRTTLRTSFIKSKPLVAESFINNSITSEKYVFSLL